MKALPYIAFRIREHGLHAWVCQNHVKAVIREDGQDRIAIVNDWKEARELLGY